MPLDHTAHQALDAAKQEDQRSRRMLTTADCAKALNVSQQFIRDEIRDKRLAARVLTREGRQRARYRIDPSDFDNYRQAHWPKSA